MQTSQYLYYASGVSGLGPSLCCDDILAQTLLVEHKKRSFDDEKMILKRLRQCKSENVKHVALSLFSHEMGFKKEVASGPIENLTCRRDPISILNLPADVQRFLADIDASDAIVNEELVRQFAMFTIEPALFEKYSKVLKRVSKAVEILPNTMFQYHSPVHGVVRITRNVATGKLYAEKGDCPIRNKHLLVSFD